MTEKVPSNFAMSGDSVRSRLLDAAEVLFCEKGYEGTSVRDLTTKANCNVASVNYYFGGKDKLYIEMFRRQMQFIVENQVERMNQLAASPNPTLEQLIREIVYYPLRAAYEKQQRGQVMRLMVREVLNSSLAGEKLIDDFRTQIMEKVVAVLMCLVPELNKKQAQLIFASIESLQLHPFLFMDNYLSLIEGLTFDQLIDHIVRFGAAAIRGMVNDIQRRSERL
jgi:AcrR family transcriptional regulator